MTADSTLELVYITRDNQHYLAMLSGAESQFEQLRSDLHSLLDSWAWQR